MGIINLLPGKSLFIDTAPLIYFIEGKSIFRDKLFLIFQGNEQGKFRIQTSVITLTEVLVHPLRSGRKDLKRQYESILLNSPFFDIYELDVSTAITAAELRGKYKLKTPDAFQMAAALTRKADFFLTNDQKLKIVTEIKVLTPDDL